MVKGTETIRIVNVQGRRQNGENKLVMGVNFPTECLKVVEKVWRERGQAAFEYRDMLVIAS